jgi:hypothetical protein
MQWQRDERIYKAVSGQLLDKHVPAARQLQHLDYNNGNGMFSMWFVPRCYEQDSFKRVQLRDSGQPAIAWAREAKESPLLEAVTRERLVKIQQAGHRLADAVVICEMWRLAVAL